jgi:hypothetical protein
MPVIIFKKTASSCVLVRVQYKTWFISFKDLNVGPLFFNNFFSCGLVRARACWKNWGPTLRSFEDLSVGPFFNNFFVRARACSCVLNKKPSQIVWRYQNMKMRSSCKTWKCGFCFFDSCVLVRAQCKNYIFSPIYEKTTFLTTFSCGLVRARACWIKNRDRSSGGLKTWKRGLRAKHENEVFAFSTRACSCVLSAKTTFSHQYNENVVFALSTRAGSCVIVRAQFVFSAVFNTKNGLFRNLRPRFSFGFLYFSSIERARARSCVLNVKLSCKTWIWGFCFFESCVLVRAQCKNYIFSPI